ncbi:MAG: DNA integrity scanning protein DisA nucleotide-binding domain protein, partial [Desulfobacterales bacterium]
VPLEAPPHPEILLSIFQETSPLHDGALILRRGRVVEVGCFLPLSSDEGLPQKWGTRHRAALGITERCDAWAIVVSEERGEISLARGGKLIPVESPATLSKTVSSAYSFAAPAGKPISSRVLATLRYNWRVKLGCLGLVCIVWLLLAGQQNFEVSLAVPVELKNVPPTLSVVEPASPQIRITVQGLRKDASTISPKEVHIHLDLANAAPGSYSYRIFQNQIILPNPQVAVVKVEPPELNIVLAAKPKPDANKPVNGPGRAG